MDWLITLAIIYVIFFRDKDDDGCGCGCFCIIGGMLLLMLMD